MCYSNHEIMEAALRRQKDQERRESARMSRAIDRLIQRCLADPDNCPDRELISA